MLRRWFLALVCPVWHRLLASAEALEPDQSWPPPEGERAIELYDDLGNLSFDINASELAQKYFNQGFRLVAAFDFRRAVLSFRAAAAESGSGGCALCAWGEALALGPNLNTFDEPRLLASLPSAFHKSLEALELLGSSAAPLARRLIRALLKRYAATAARYVEQEALLTRNYALEMEQLLSEVPVTDVNYANLVALTADAWMNTHPWDYWISNDTSSSTALRPEALKALELLRGALRRAPSHAFCVHLLVHVTEASGNRSLLEEVRPLAERLPQLLPGAPHLIHMSFHTLMHTGDFHRADGDNRWASELPRQIYPMHNLDTLSWVCRIQGRSLCSLDAAKSLEHRALKLVGSGSFETGFPPARFAAVWPLTLLAFGRFRQILEEHVPREVDQEAFLAGIWHFVRGSAFAHLEHPHKAEEELQKLRSRRSEVEKKMSEPAGVAWKNFNGSKAWAVYPADRLLRLAEAELTAWQSAGTAAGTAAWWKAWELEAALPYDEPPAWYLPVANRLGAALLAEGQLDKAWDVYSKSLSHLPNDGWAMLGLVQVCQRRGVPRVDCEELQRNFERAWRYADVTLKNSADVDHDPRGLWLAGYPPAFRRALPWISMAAVAFLVPLLRHSWTSTPCAGYHRFDAEGA